jgi:hypothetical protein
MYNHISGRNLLHATLVIALLFLGGATDVLAQSPLLPPIISGPTNAVPSCVTPSRLMEFADTRNRRLDSSREFDRRFSDIASVYKSAGECVEIKRGGPNFIVMALELQEDRPGRGVPHPNDSVRHSGNDALVCSRSHSRQRRIGLRCSRFYVFLYRSGRPTPSRTCLQTPSQSSLRHW